MKSVRWILTSVRMTRQIFNCQLSIINYFKATNYCEYAQEFDYLYFFLGLFPEF